nr:MAG TPA: hypothetical protein [Caudoviricetes sp.]
MLTKLYLLFELTVLLICMQLLIGFQIKMYVLEHKRYPSFWRWMSVGIGLVYAASVMATALL